jgi:renalase
VQQQGVLFDAWRREDYSGRMKPVDVLVLGAGIAGLQCARRLLGAGAEVLVVDRADKPGGRCATRLFDGQPVDYGPVFIHGDNPDFLAALNAVDLARIDGWPNNVRGRGLPCQPEAFAPFETRFALAEGVNAFPRALAQSLSIRLRSLVDSIALEGDVMTVTLSSGEKLAARDVVLAMALEQSATFVRTMASVERARSVSALLEMFSSAPCLTMIAGYEPSVHVPAWDIVYPEDEHALLLISNESSKRPQGAGRVLVFQASARWSRQRLNNPKEEWSRELLQVAARRLGAWAGTPRWTHLHRWRYSRVDRANELTGPLIMEEGKSRLGITGDLFSPGGGMQASWVAGDRLGAKLVVK